MTSTPESSCSARRGAIVIALDVNIARERGLLGSSTRIQTRTPVAKDQKSVFVGDRNYWLQLSELLRLAWRLERRAPDLPVLLVSNEPSADRALSQLSIDCNKLEGSAVMKIAGYSRAVGQSRWKGRVRIGTVEGKLRGVGLGIEPGRRPGNRTRPSWSNSSSTNSMPLSVRVPSTTCTRSGGTRDETETHMSDAWHV